MTEFLPPERFDLVLDGGAPLIRLSDVSVDGLDGWTLLNRVTVVVVDGPGDQGFLLARLGPQGDGAPAGWDAAVEAKGGAWVEVPGRARFHAQLVD